MKELYSNQMWFVYGYYAAAGRPKMEDEIFLYARHILLYHMVYESDFNAIITLLNRKQQELHDKNKRLKEVDIAMTVDIGLVEGNRWLKIGAQALHLRRIEGEFFPDGL